MISALTVITGFTVVLAETTLDKSKYHLFNPVPDTALKDMSTDRPDRTEGPFTVDPGHYQVEFDFINLTRDKNKSENTRTLSSSWLAPNIRIGLLDRLELDVILSPYTRVRTKDLTNRDITRQQGFGDIIGRIKYNFWGNEGKDRTALGIIPFIKFPTNKDNLGNEYHEGGIILPFNITITDKSGLGLMTEVDRNRAENENKHVFVLINSASLGYEFTDKLGGYIEIYTEKSRETHARWLVTFDVGATYAITDNLQIDAGINIGVTRAADDFNPFLGMSIRF